MGAARREAPTRARGGGARGARALAPTQALDPSHTPSHRRAAKRPRGDAPGARSTHSDIVMIIRSNFLAASLAHCHAPARDATPHTMVQEFWAVRCHACGAFQCTQVRAASRHHAARSGCLRRRSISGVAVLLHHGACATALVLSLTPARALGTLSAVHVQAKKSMGFTCVVCGEKTRRVRAVLMASNDARDCRRYVQMRNAGAGEEQEALGEAKALAEVEARAGWEDDLAEADQYDQCPDGDYDAADTFGVGAGGTLAALERAEELNKEQRGEYERARERDSRRNAC